MVLRVAQSSHPNHQGYFLVAVVLTNSLNERVRRRALSQRHDDESPPPFLFPQDSVVSYPMQKKKLEACLADHTRYKLYVWPCPPSAPCRPPFFLLRHK